ncbi:MAG: ferrous iron transport protein B [Patescibacteria group bacterium]|nr:ferrous iron transport protein B [Patescibacteria group bacterium]
MRNKSDITVALAANPNAGKTSLLNSLTGLNSHVGNWSGKTVEKMQGFVKYKEKKIKIVDLPGTYSILPYSNEEKIARDFLLEEDSDVIIQVIDVNCLERNLLLTFELLAFNKKLILAFNFNKEARKKGLKIDVDRIREVLELPIIEIEAYTRGKKEVLFESILDAHTGNLKVPSYLNKILKSENEVSHRASLDFIEKNILPFYHPSEKETMTMKIDSWFLNKYTGLPIFFFLVYLMFKITFVLSTPLINLLGFVFEYFSSLVNSLPLPAFWSSLLADGMIGGVGSVLSFTPLIFILFLLIALLEDTGYLARTVIMLDRLFHKFGISGQTFLPMILGFGCNVPAIMATRTIQHRKERLIAIFINSFMSCSARLPVYVLFTGIFFPSNAAIVIMILYFGGVLVGLATSYILSRLIKIDGENVLILELPPYRLPSLKNTLKHAWWQMNMFIKKAGTLILGAIVFIWIFASLPFGSDYGSAQSYLGQFGQFIAPIFEPLGFGHWTFSVALIFGVVAKEIIIGTLGTLHGVSADGLAAVLPNFITPLGSFSFLVFILLYVPCLATVATIKTESGSWKFTIFHFASVSLIAWIVAFVVYQGGLVLGFG